MIERADADFIEAGEGTRRSINNGRSRNVIGEAGVSAASRTASCMIVRRLVAGRTRGLDVVGSQRGYMSVIPRVGSHTAESHRG